MVLWQSGYRQPSRRISQLIWQQDGGWSIQFANGARVDAELAPQSWVTSWMWCLRFHSSDLSVPPLLIWRSQFPDSVWQVFLTRLHLQGHKPDAEVKLKSV